jgi:membrane peptidoglycan carboxypeptidase
MPENVANNVTKVLENVIENGTGQNAKALGRAAAGKTGTTDANKSAWFVGYTQQLSTSVAMFREDPESHKLLSMNGTAGVDSIHGGDIPTAVWTEYMKAALDGKPDPGFPEATKIGEVADQSGAPSPSASASASPSESASESPSASPSGPSTPPTPSTSGTCSPWDFDCEESGGNGNGGADTGGGGVTPTPTETDTGDPGNSRGNGNGGLFGGNG